MADTVKLNHQSSIDVKITVGETELHNVSEIPDLLPAPETIEVTAIGDDTKQYIPGLKDPGNLEFTLWYDAATYNSLQALEKAGAEQTITITLKDTSTIVIKGKITLGFSGFGAGDAVSFTMSVAATSVKVTPAGTAA